MKILHAAAVGIGLLILGGCAVYDPYPVYQPYPAPPVVVQPRVYGYWDGHRGRHWGGHHHHRRHWGHGHGHGRGHGHGHRGHW